MKIELLGTSILIKRDSAEKETAGGIFLGDNPEKLSTGVIVKVGSDLLHAGALEKRVRFRENFAEPLMIDGGEYLFFRELESSIYYYIYE